jgi:biotin synthase
MRNASACETAARGVPGDGWHGLAGRLLEGRALSSAEGLAVLRSPDEELLDLLAAAYRVRYRWFGNRVHLNFLVNAQSGWCGEDCGYCSQSRVSEAAIPRYPLLDADAIVAGAEAAVARRAGTYCIVISGRSPGDRQLDLLAAAVARIKKDLPLKICASLGLLTPAQAIRLKQCGVDRVNHNLNTSERFYPRICSTHTYQDRLETLRAIRDAGLEICSGGIVGMGEEDADVVELALRLGELCVEAVPVNFLIPIPGTPLAHLRRLDPRYCLKVLALMRLANPRAELRIAGGRELHLGSLQPLGLFAANSIFVGDYLTTKGQPPEDDYRMIADLGFEAVPEGDG